MFATSVLRRAFLVGPIAGLVLAATIGAIAALWIAPERGVPTAVAIGVGALIVGLVWTTWFATTNAVLRGAADAVSRHGFAQILMERVFELACQTVPGLAAHEVSRQIDPADRTVLRDALQRLRQTACGAGRGVRRRVATWLFDAVVRRMDAAVARLLAEGLKAGETVSFGAIPGLAAGLVNESVARRLRSAAWRSTILWLAVLCAIVAGVCVAGA